MLRFLVILLLASICSMTLAAPIEIMLGYNNNESPPYFMGEGTKILEFDLDESFFRTNENELLGKCGIHQQVAIEKKADLMTFVKSQEKEKKSKEEKIPRN